MFLIVKISPAWYPGEAQVWWQRCLAWRDPRRRSLAGPEDEEEDEDEETDDEDDEEEDDEDDITQEWGQRQVMVVALLVIFSSEKEVLQQNCDRTACQKAWHVMACGNSDP